MITPPSDEYIPRRNFRAQGKVFALTYPQSDFDLQEYIADMQIKTCGSKRIIEIVVCAETHQDGSPHRHALIRWSGRVDIRHADYFDFQNRHANVQVARNPNAWRNYIKKDNTFEVWVPSGQPVEEENSIYDNAREMEEEEFFEYCRRNNVPYGFADRAWRTVTSKRELITYREDPNPDLAIPFPRELAEYELKTDLVTNVIVGPSGCGKTTYCLRNMTKPVLFVTHVDDLNCYSPRVHKSILFDDMTFTHLHREAQIHLVDRYLPRTVHRRYGTSTIYPGTQVTLTANTPPILYGDEAIRRRINLLEMI